MLGHFLVEFLYPKPSIFAIIKNNNMVNRYANHLEIIVTTEEKIDSINILLRLFSLFINKY
jgi:hypothetical protein